MGDFSRQKGAGTEKVVTSLLLTGKCQTDSVKITFLGKVAIEMRLGIRS